jgi:Maltose-binding periplasmic proteins/domains
LEVAPVPVGTKPVTSAWLSAWVMSPDTKYPNEAWKLLKFITSKEMELKWFKDNSVLSSRKDVTGAAPEVLNNKYAQVIASQLKYARLVPQIAEWPEIIETVTDAVQNAISETKTPEEAIYEAHLKVEEILSHKNN